MATAVISIILIVVCIFGIRSYVKKLSSGCCGSGGDAVKREKPEDSDLSHYPFQYQLGIEGMTCKNCAARIENAFNTTGSFYAAVNLGQKSAVVHSKEKTTEEELRKIVAKCGYSVTGFSVITE